MKLIPQILILMMTLSCSEDIPAGNITLSPEENITPSPEEGADPSPEEDEDVQPEITVEEPDFGEEVKVLPPAGASMVYSPSLITRNYRPVSTKYIKTWSASPSWIDAKARIVPYLEGFEDYQMSRKEYVLSTNRYGSSTTLPRQEATGRFYVRKVEGRFYLVDPEGYLHHHRGVASLRPSKDGSGADNAAFIQKYGDRANWLSEVQEELAAIGFHSSGAFSSPYDDLLAYNRTNPEKPVLICPSFGFLSQFKKKYKDLTYCSGDSDTAICLVLDERWGTFCEEYISEGEVKKYLHNRHVVGIFSDNEINFSSQSKTNLELVLNSNNTEHPVYKAAKKFMEERGAEKVTASLNNDWAGMLAELYYKGVKDALKKYDPGMLYLGSRLHGTPKMMEKVVKAAGKWCDVISINYYSKWNVEAVDHVSKWAEWAPKTPFMITEFYTKGYDSELPNSAGAGWIVPTQKERAFAYQHFTLGLIEAKNCVGWHWFKYQDDDIVEYGEKASNKGLYDKDYNIFPWLAEYARILNYNVYRLIEYFDK